MMLGGNNNVFHTGFFGQLKVAQTMLPGLGLIGLDLIFPPQEAQKVGKIAEKTPLIKEISGSLLIEAKK